MSPENINQADQAATRMDDPSGDDFRARVELEVRDFASHSAVHAPSISATADLTWDDIFRAVGIELFAPLDCRTLSRLLGDRLASKHKDDVSVQFPDGSRRPWGLVGPRRFALAVPQVAMQGILRRLEGWGYLDSRRYGAVTKWALSDAGLHTMTNGWSIQHAGRSVEG